MQVFGGSVLQGNEAEPLSKEVRLLMLGISTDSFFDFTKCTPQSSVLREFSNGPDMMGTEGQTSKYHQTGCPSLVLPEPSYGFP